MIGEIPQDTETRAFNANNVASVYISSGYGDLLTTEETAEGGTSTFNDAALSLADGFYGMSDPSNLQGKVQKFEVELGEGAVSSETVRIRLLNPTNELELFLFGIYNAAFPASNTSYDYYAEAAKQAAAQTTITALSDTPQQELLKRGKQLPFLYVRWGYGTNEKEGLSRIHKCVLFGCNYDFNANEDKVIELHLIDWFTNLVDNEVFNIRPQLTKIDGLGLYFDVNKASAGNVLGLAGQVNTLKPFSVCIAELMTKYANVFKGVLPIFETGNSNMEKLDTLVNNLAVLQWNEYLAYKASEEEARPKNFSASSTPEMLVPEEGESLVEITLPQDLAAGKDFSDTQSKPSQANLTWINAYKQTFDFLGISCGYSSARKNRKPVAYLPPEVWDVIPADSSLGEAFNQQKDGMLFDTAELGIKYLSFYIPSTTVKPMPAPPQAKDPGAVSTALAKKIPFEAPRDINYNIDTDNDLDGEMFMNLGHITVSGTPAGPKYQQKIMSRRGSERNRVQTFTERDYIHFDDLEKLYLQVVDLENAVNANPTITPNSRAYDLMPSVYLRREAIIRQFLGNPYPQKFVVEGDYMHPKNEDLSLLLYAPDDTADRVDDPAYNPPSTGASNPPVVPAGGFRQRVIYYYKNPDIDDTHPSGDRVTGIGDMNILGLNLSLSDKAQPFIKLMPTPATIRKIKEVYLECYSELSLAAKRDTIDLEGFDLWQNLLTWGQTTRGWLRNPAASEQRYRQRMHEMYGAEGEVLANELAKAYAGIGMYEHEVTIGLGTGVSMTPHITRTWSKVIDGINKLIVGEKDKYVVQQIDCNSLTPKGFAQTFGPNGIFTKYFPKELHERFKKVKPVLVLIGRSSWINDVFEGNLLARVHSFPEITRTHPKYKNDIFLSYGTEGSIVTDLKFRGDIRTLYNIPQTFYASQQYTDLKQLFETQSLDSAEVDSQLTELIKFVFVNSYSEELSELDERRLGATEAADRQAATARLAEVNEVITEVTNIKTLNYTIHKEYLDAFPQLLSEFSDQDLLDEGFKDISSARKITSILGTKDIAELLFPVKFDEKGYPIQESSHTSYDVMYRQLDVSHFYKKLSEVSDAAMDAKWNYIELAQNESWVINLTTLGIPEIDIMGAEFFARNVHLDVHSPRGDFGRSSATKSGLHWLSGRYKITGIKHDLSPDHGYTTSLSLVKIPGEFLKI